jgi:hypothetical protein
LNTAPGFTGQPGPGIAASSLLDANALPQWMRDNSQGTQAGAGGNSGSPGLSAGSLIDMNNLPAWLRTAEQEPQGGYHPPATPGTFGGSGGYGSPGGQGIPPRVESMRVPSRPRAEMAPLEQSEMAANVFSSMLGVASVSPVYPPAPSSPMGGYPAQQPFQAMPQVPGPNQQWTAPGGSPITQPGQQGIVSGSPLASPYPGTAAQPIPTSPYGQPGLPPTGMGMGQPVGEQKGETIGPKVARRGFLETIRGWFHL